MKSIYSIFLFSILVYFAQAQKTSTPSPDERLIEAYGPDYINTLQTENPYLIKRWNFYLDNAFFITDKNADKVFTDQTISIADINEINILKLEKEQKMTRSWDLPIAYQIENTNKLLIYHSGKEFNKKLKAYLKQ